MAQMAAFSVYQINQYSPISLGDVQKYGFSPASCLVRAIPANLALLSTGVYCYSSIQLVANGTQYYVVETQATILTAFNA